MTKAEFEEDRTDLKKYLVLVMTIDSPKLA